ncbi:MAG TPA: hypothetical protein VGG31_03655, partial [Candidatus Dormibacteraeota bacterium]
MDLFSGGPTYTLSVAGGDGKVAARVTALKRTNIADGIELPYTMATRSRVYYLDGDRAVRSLNLDGTSKLVTSVAGSASVHATFAVSPDDQRIAVGLLDYSVSPVLLSLYVEDIGGGHHSVIYTSNARYLWPVAWHAGQLVVAYLGPGAVPFKSKTTLYGNGDLLHFPYGPSPYGGINYHVINPVTAEREAIISGGGATGLLSRAGTAVAQGDADDWTGASLNWNSPSSYGNYSAAGSLSPNGGVIAACCENGAASSGNLVLFYPNDVRRVLPVNVTPFDWVGWLDDSHLVTGFYQAADGTPSV